MTDYPPDVTLRLQMDELRAIVEYAATSAAAGARICPECGARVFVQTGKRLGLSWFTHELISDCIYDYPGKRIIFHPTENKTSREVALAAEKIFYES